MNQVTFPLALQSHAQSTRIVSIIIIPLLHLFGSVTSLLDYLAFFRSKLILYITFSSKYISNHYVAHLTLKQCRVSTVI